MADITVGYLKQAFADLPNDTRIVVPQRMNYDGLMEPAYFAEKYYFNQGCCYDTLNDAIEADCVESEVELVVCIS